MLNRSGSERFDAWDGDSRAWDACMSGRGLDGWDEKLPRLERRRGRRHAGRRSTRCLNATAESASRSDRRLGDLTGNTGREARRRRGPGDVNPGGRQVHFGIREHAMASVMNGLAYHGGTLPIGGTFFIFSDYMRPAVRLAALSQCHVIYSWTHDSVGLGEDGPTHQPIEQLASLRAMPGLATDPSR